MHFDTFAFRPFFYIISFYLALISIGTKNIFDIRWPLAVERLYE